MKRVRLYVKETLLQDISLVLNLQQSHYIQNVMRLKNHDDIFLFNGKDGEWLGEIIDVSCKSVKIKIKNCIEKQQYEENLYLYCAIVKSTALNNIIRQATEMGVTCIQFILTKHTVIRDVNLERAKLQAIEAAEQCGRMDIPEVLSPINFCDLPDSQDKNFILCDKTGKMRQEPNKNIALITGPEGGFSDDELDFANKFCQKLSLGKRILRVDTAVVAALSYLEASTKKY
ncbi:MAG TPA: 16S rRNA (uracil(1498)-N(3))-methyltransferase [Wolbachia sp.]|jgi:16S rRNA (uracil1498-N3)-methyltransferase|uniref:16S rRNA (uracil(1498)-N(3))-methyltransferase n=1 Tax=Wolbachia endosymbiont of Pentalonia nigronervosa TaxID=1301914 RepID=UPI000ED5655F|nr:16S rRNA (uracil(1498)-N(3))-methyltransferase [Wolbachia endosymbiont of Pentalonia nigronervosa]MBD0391072.1 16S rRNA (uracil(1498)-N(3))-methyltransferase [Wolbachia endosymbiont of Pentalonia nigronervosa]HCE59245.1 16S rRNA (uracil(1498)-N(3))-methyltransferase [Wolbachia sp.]